MSQIFPCFHRGGTPVVISPIPDRPPRYPLRTVLILYRLVVVWKDTAEERLCGEHTMRTFQLVCLLSRATAENKICVFLTHSLSTRVSFPTTTNRYNSNTVLKGYPGGRSDIGDTAVGHSTMVEAWENWHNFFTLPRKISQESKQGGLPP